MKADELVVIAGASGGLGLSVTEFLLNSGRRKLACHYRSHPTDISNLLKRFDLDPAMHLVQADLSSEPEVAQFRNKVHSRFGDAFALVNLVGSSSNRMSWKMSLVEFEGVLAANVRSVFLTCREFIPEMRAQERGRIINVSSVVAYIGAAGASHYCAAKSAVLGFTKSLALELAPKNIFVSAVALGYMDFGLIHQIPESQQEDIKGHIPAKRFGTGAEAGNLIQYLLGDGGGYSGGQVYHLNGGLYG